jgi:hypothetical protein
MGKCNYVKGVLHNLLKELIAFSQEKPPQKTKVWISQPTRTGQLLKKIQETKSSQHSY